MKEKKLKKGLYARNPAFIYFFIIVSWPAGRYYLFLVESQYYNFMKNKTKQKKQMSYYS